MQITFSEKELEDFLCKDKNLEKYLDLKFIARQVNIAPAGIVDILGYHKPTKTWVIIELKKDTLDLSALGQGLSYLRFYQDTKKHIFCHKTPFLKRSRNFCLLLIGSNLDPSLHKIVKKFHDYDPEDNNLTYALFGIEIENGIKFTFYNRIQSEYDTKLNDICETNELTRSEILNGEKPSRFF